jgi:hypothetical protein
MDGLDEVIRLSQCDWYKVTSIANRRTKRSEGPISSAPLSLRAPLDNPVALPANTVEYT